jgi:hypothetical protein
MDVWPYREYTKGDAHRRPDVAPGLGAARAVADVPKGRRDRVKSAAIRRKGCRVVARSVARARGAIATFAHATDQAVAVEHGMNGALGRNSDVAVSGRSERTSRAPCSDCRSCNLSSGIYRTPGTHPTLTRRPAGGRRNEGALPSPNSLSTGRSKHLVDHEKSRPRNCPRNSHRRHFGKAVFRPVVEHRHSERQGDSGLQQLRPPRGT